MKKYFMSNKTDGEERDNEVCYTVLILVIELQVNLPFSPFREVMMNPSLLCLSAVAVRYTTQCSS